MAVAKMNLERPVFDVDVPKPANANILFSIWWLWRMLDTLHPPGLLGGIYANKSGFHNRGNANIDHGVGKSTTNYSIRDAINRSGPGWNAASALDWTFPNAQSGNYSSIKVFTLRLWNAAHNAADPRLDMGLFEFFGQMDDDRTVEGYNEYKEANETSDSSHLWHLHLSFIRSKVGDMWAMWAIYTVLAGWSVAKWKASLPEAPKPPVTPPVKPSAIPVHKPGSRVIRYTTSPYTTGTDVLYVQTFIGRWRDANGNWIAITRDGTFNRNTHFAVVWYQKMRGLTADGIVGPKTWAALLS
jgi:hypothetical protein